MDRIAEMASAERATLMRLASDRRKALSPAVVEKDFWVCWTLNRLFPTDHVAVFLWPKGNGDFSNPMLKYACNHARFTVVDKKDTPLFLEEDVLIEKKTYVVTEQETWEDIFVRIKKERFPD